jgi:Fe-S cluster assembly scaffold protein SufB
MGLDGSQLFYLRSRGLSENSAAAVLRDAFAEEILRYFPKTASSL